MPSWYEVHLYLRLRCNCTSHYRNKDMFNQSYGTFKAYVDERPITEVTRKVVEERDLESILDLGFRCVSLHLSLRSARTC